MDGALRQIDGVMEVRWGDETPLRAEDPPERVQQVALRWCNWWRAWHWRTDAIGPVTNDT